MSEVDERFVERLASTYMMKYKANGEKTAMKWFLSFIPKPLQARVFNAIREGRFEK